MAELLVEFLSEEIPARMQRRAGDDLVRLLSEGLTAANLGFDAIASYTTPRRLAVRVDGLPVEQPARQVERKGPRTDAPHKAIDGFLGSIAIPLDQCEVREDKKGSFYVAVWEEAGRNTAEVLPGLILDAAQALPWPKSMRWGTTTMRWVRPLHSVLAVFDGAVLDGALDTGDGALSFTDETRGHRFLAPDAFKVHGFAAYRDRLRDAKVLVDPAEREAAIRAQMKELCAGAGLEEPDDDALYAEVTGLVEWPVVLLGTIDPRYMDLPSEVLITSMREHQKYFGLHTRDGALAPRFAFVSNLATDNAAAIVAGNERVLRARLSDARHFWDLDLATPLDARTPALDGIVFHARLGSIGEKSTRVEALAGWIGARLDGADPDAVSRAAKLAKADLVSGMVGEFPELQGVMGRYYARAQGESAAVAEAIAAHYSPLGPADTCPTAPTSVAVALADKLDILSGFWMIDEKPTGSKDPFALRRAALGVIRLILENGIRITLRDLLARARAGHANDNAAQDDDLLAFFADRLKVHLRDAGVRHDLIEAVFGQGGDGDLVAVVARVHALAAFAGSEDGANLLTAYRRAANIVRAEEKKDDTVYAGDAYSPDGSAGEPIEARLWESLQETEGTLGPALMEERYEDAMRSLAGLRRPVDEFFDKVTVNVDDSVVRGNRLRLLARIQGVMNNVADFSRVEG
jgi:glycyl-tRNA synthetase beta chain